MFIIRLLTPRQAESMNYVLMLEIDKSPPHLTLLTLL